MTLTHQYHAALALAYELHRDQTRKGSEVPYISHLLAVSALVLEHGGDEDQAIAGLLHDALEDQGDKITADQIEDRFGLRVRRIVEACGEADKALSWKERNQRYIEHLRTAPDDAVLVSLCDKVHNATAMADDHADSGPQFWSRFNAGYEEQSWKYNQLLEAFKARAANPHLVARLERAMQRMGMA